MTLEDHIIAKGRTLRDAAEVMGCGYSTLANYLNGSTAAGPKITNGVAKLLGIPEGRVPKKNDPDAAFRLNDDDGGELSAELVTGDFIVRELRDDENGNMVIRAKSKNRAVEIIMRMPLTLGSAIALREIYEPTRYPPHRPSSKAAVAAEAALTDAVEEPGLPKPPR